jgi:hypothetical protein
MFCLELLRCRAEQQSQPQACVGGHLRGQCMVGLYVVEHRLAHRLAAWGRPGSIPQACAPPPGGAHPMWAPYLEATPGHVFFFFFFDYLGTDITDAR